MNPKFIQKFDGAYVVYSIYRILCRKWRRFTGPLMHKFGRHISLPNPHIKSSHHTVYTGELSQVVHYS